MLVERFRDLERRTECGVTGYSQFSTRRVPITGEHELTFAETYEIRRNLV